MTIKEKFGELAVSYPRTTDGLKQLMTSAEFRQVFGPAPPADEFQNALDWDAYTHTMHMRDLANGLGAQYGVTLPHPAPATEPHATVQACAGCGSRHIKHRRCAHCGAARA